MTVAYDLILTVTSGNTYEHLGLLNPISLEIIDGIFTADEIQGVSGIFFDIPIDIQLDDLVFDVRD